VAKSYGERVPLYAAKLDVSPKKNIVKEQGKRWGSCSSEGTINYNWKAIMTPVSVIDYVIAHELGHLKYPHHQPEYWQALSSIVPDCKQRRDWLKRNGSLLTV
jgi:predicted metal-dependent hydrolase